MLQAEFSIRSTHNPILSASLPELIRMSLASIHDIVLIYRHVCPHLEAVYGRECQASGSGEW
jgi:hypothetical protein